VLWLVPGLAFTNKYRCEFVNLFCIYAGKGLTHFQDTFSVPGRQNVVVYARMLTYTGLVDFQNRGGTHL